MNEFKKLNDFDKRKGESEHIIRKHPERIPIVVCKNCGDDLPDIDKQKYLVPKEMSIGQFMYVIRKRIKLDASQALFIMVNNTLQPSNKVIDEIYKSCKDDDGYLYIVYSSENTFG